MSFILGNWSVWCRIAEVRDQWSCSKSAGATKAVGWGLMWGSANANLASRRPGSDRRHTPHLSAFHSHSGCEAPANHLDLLLI